MTTMLALRATAATEPLRLAEIPVPEPGPGDVLVKVSSAGLAPGMMAMLAMGMFKHLPTTVGHEAAGTVEAVGDAVDPALAGQRVRVHAMLSCRSCAFCRAGHEQMCTDAAMLGGAAFGTGPLELYRRYHHGGLAEYLRVPHWQVDVLPDAVSFDVAAKVHDLGTAVSVLKQTSLPLGGTLVVTAATGAMGAATIKLAPFFGAGRLVLVGRSAKRLDALRAIAGVPVDTVALEELGADWATTGGLTRRIRDLVPGGADAVVDLIPQGPATAQALTALATGGTLVHLGGNFTPLELPPAALMVNLWRLVGTRACGRTDTDQVLALLASGALHLDDLITHRFPLAEALEGIESMRNRPEPMWMSVVRP